MFTLNMSQCCGRNVLSMYSLP